jgi:predicted secreted protein
MKKLILSTAIFIGSMSAFAATLPAQNTQNQLVLVQEEYTEIKADAVPQAVKAAMEIAYPGAVLHKAYIDAKKEYKLEIKVGDQNATVYADAEGNWINK